MSDEVSRHMVNIPEARELLALAAGVSGKSYSTDELFNEEWTRCYQLRAFIAKIEAGGVEVAPALLNALEGLEMLGRTKSLQAVPAPYRIIMGTGKDAIPKTPIFTYTCSKLIESFFALESGILFVYGKGRSGKTARAFAVLGEVYRRTGRPIRVYKFPVELVEALPVGFSAIQSMKDTDERDIVLWDDSIIRLSSRKQRNEANVELGEYTTVVSHAQQHLVFVVQNLMSMDVLATRHQEVALLVCPSSSATIGLEDERAGFVAALMRATSMLDDIASEYPNVDKKSFSVLWYGAEKEILIGGLPHYWTETLSRPFADFRRGLKSI